MVAAAAVVVVEGGLDFGFGDEEVCEWGGGCEDEFCLVDNVKKNARCVGGLEGRTLLS